MNIINSNLRFRSTLAWGNNPEVVVLHHAGAKVCSIEDIHRWHLENGWCGCGYHYLVRKNGTIYTGRNEKAVGAHCPGYNSRSIGICAEGDFNVEVMGQTQYSALLELTRSMLSKYGISKVYGHRELYSTDCPGGNFPLDRIRSEAAGSSGRLVYPGYLIKMNPGLEDSNVKAVQEKLMIRGYSVGRCGADGFFGGGTLEAVKSFQRDSGLAVDGIVGINTWNRLFG
ncbi:peptidoglycan recognition protein family protein [Clostridium coskatii]|uniref:N-acetylmuramoyl-L-alanine amidase n=1 Tax=Clostridium coskatii TaxID=1705578 RepID=A0A168MWB4_9CLOT|nr:N-acetylmuramoyl-L-alanine amidase [Clostridium coskatii]OAA85390.1 N-acetylmuramoyl-L-alanine amidase [Clostridium coskatii]OBR91364.1 N-acetylmuramoyl-L-alanine amidase [Clostridium coskatii]